MKQPAVRRGPLQQRAEIKSSSRAFPRMKDESVPRNGWVREIRTALGLSQSQLAARAGVSRATVQQMEQAEAQRRITLASLDKLANAMGCRVALAILPKTGTLDDVRRQQALAKAEVLLHEKIKDNKRPPRPADLERRKQQLVTRLLRGSRRRLWRP
jgi:predicted DNA-binding mobile mystery protein A